MPTRRAAAWRDGFVPVRLEETGSIVIGAEPPAIAGWEFVGVIGTAVYVDPAAPERPPLAIVADLDSAEDAVVELYGETVAEAARHVAARAPGEPVAARLATSETLRDVQRLGVQRWLRHTLVLPFDLSVAAADLLTLQTRCRHVLDEETPDLTPTVTLALEASPLLLALRDRHGVVRELAEDLLDVAAGYLLPSPEITEAMVRLTTELDHSPLQDNGADEDRLDEELRRLLAGTRPRQPQLAGEARIVAEGVATAAWDRTDGRVLSRAEDDVTWAVVDTADGTSVVRVSATAAHQPHPLIPGVPAHRGSAPPAATILAPGWPLPVAQGVLLDQGDGTWQADLPIGAGARADVHADAVRGALRVDVHDARIVRPPRSGADADADLARRWGARGVWLTRAATGAPGPAGAELRSAAAQAFRRARNVWVDLSARTAGSVDQVVTDRIALCDSLSRTLDGGGDGEASARPRQFGAGAGGPVAAPPVYLDDPGWWPSAAEVLAQEHE